jgi:ABC-type dipeptide/oligopeptide/nickel transport system ATPase component
MTKKYATLVEKLEKEKQTKEAETRQLAKKVEENIKKATEELDREVNRILHSDNPPAEIKKHLDNLIAGEDTNKQVIFYLCLSGKIPNPKDKQFVLIKGEAGGGKSTMMSLADFFNTKCVARFTATALDYSDFTGVEILKLTELNDEEKQGIGNLKFLSSEDGGYTIEYTIRDEKGRFTTEQRRIPPLTVISSTTTVHLDEQLERRAWILNPDTSRAQTRRILRFKAKRKYQEDLKALGVISETSYERSYEILAALVRKLKPVKVVIPFINTLVELMKDRRLRVRGDFDKIVTFISLYHQVWQEKLPKVQINGETVLFADPWITLDALELIHEPLVNMLSGVEAREQQVLNLLEKFGIREKGDEVTKEVRQRIAKELGLTSEKRIREILNELEDAGYFISEGGTRGKPKVYYLSDQLKNIKLETSQILGYSGDSERRQNTAKEMAKEALEMLNSILEIPDLTVRYEKYLKEASGTGEVDEQSATLPEEVVFPETNGAQNKEISAKGDRYSGGVANRQNSAKIEISPKEAHVYLEAFNICKWHAWGSNAYRCDLDQWEHAKRQMCSHIPATRQVEIEEVLSIREIGTKVEIPTASVELTLSATSENSASYQTTLNFWRNAGVSPESKER